MHILIIHQAFASFDEPGGTRHYEFARLLAARGHRVTVIGSPVNYITGSSSTTADQSQGDQRSSDAGADRIVILRAPVYEAHHKSFVHRMLAFFSFMFSAFWIGLRVQQVDLVWGTSPPIFQGLTAWAVARLKGARFLFEVRDLWPKFAVAAGVLKSPLLIRPSEWLESFLYHRADRLLVNSPGFVSHVLSRGARQVDVVPNGADPAMFRPADKGVEFRRAHELEGKFVALYAGAHGMSNDLDVVLNAAARLTRSDIQVVFVGDGKEKPALQRRAAELGLRNVSFTPSVPKSGMPDALAAADACIAILKPYEEYKTTYPNKVFDYMAAGRPIVLAIDGVIREVVEAAHCGIFVPPGNAGALADAVCTLAGQPEESRRMGLNGRKYLEENFSREQVAEKLFNVLEEMKANGRQN